MTRQQSDQAPRASFDPDACVATLDQALARTLLAPGVEPAAQAALEVLLAATESARGSLMRVDPVTACLMLVAGAGIPAHLLGQPQRPRPRSIAYWVYRQRQGQLLQGTVKDPRFEAVAGAEAIESSVCVPIMSPRGPVGVLSLARSGGRGIPFGDEDLRALTTLMERLGAVLETLAHAELGSACASQIVELEGPRSLALLAPGLTEARSWEFALMKRAGLKLGSARAERVAPGDGINALMLADVPATGTEAAAVSGFVHGLFTGLLAAERSARGMAERLNAELCARQSLGAAASTWIAFLSPRGEVRSCAAGCPAPLWVPADDSDVQLLSRGGPACGLSRDAEFDEETFRLHAGDVLLGVTAGVLDARDPTDTPYGLRALGDLAGAHRHDPLDRLVACVFESLMEHGRNSLPADDQVVLAIRYTPGT